MGNRYVLGETGARKIRELLNGRGVSGSVQGSGAGLTFEDDFVHPFTVQWAASANGGSWIIWLPSDELVTADGEVYDPAQDLTAVGGDYPSGWYLLDEDVLDPDDGGTLYLNVEKVEDEETGEEYYELSFDSEASEEEDSYSVAVCEASVDSASGGRCVKSFLTSALVLGCKCVKSLIGDEEGSEVIDGEVQISGRLDPNSEETGCGIVVTTVSKREAMGEDPARPARVILDLKDRDPSEEEWGVHTITFTNPEGQGQVAHLLACGDIEIGGGGGGGGGSHDIANVVGSDYIEVADKTEGEGEEAITKRQVKAKILTGAESGETVDTHALLTNDTEQNVVAKKNFKDANGTKLIAVDGPNGTIVLTDVASGKSITLNPASIPAGCSAAAIAVHELKFKDKDNVTHSHHGLFCSDIDMTNVGKTIKSTSVTATSNGSKMTFFYTDGSQDEFIVQNGLQGLPGAPGDDGDTPEIVATRSGNTVSIFADGELIATLTDGRTPVITASKSGKTTTIYADGQPIATIEDGTTSHDDEWVQKTCITGIRFQESGGKLQAVLSKMDFWVPNWSGKVPLEYEDVQTLDIADVSELDVVTSESYSASSHQFTNQRKRVKVIGTPQDTSGQTPFTATPLSGE